MMMKTMRNLTGSMLSSIGNCPSLSLLSTCSVSSVIVLNDNHLDWNHHWPSLDIIVINLTGIIKVHLNLETELEAVRNRLRTKSTGFEHLTFLSFLLLYIYAYMYTCTFMITQVKPTSGWRWSVRSWGRSSPPSAKWSESRTTTPDHHLYYQTYFTIIILSGWLETFPHLAWVEVDNLLIGKKLARGHLPCNLSQRWCSLWCWSWIFTKVIDGIEPTMVGSMSMTRSREMFPAL